MSTAHGVKVIKNSVKACNKGTCDRVKSSECSNTAEGKINNRTFNVYKYELTIMKKYKKTIKIYS